MDELELITRPFKSLKKIKGMDYPQEVAFGDLVVTGPPGSGKSTLLAYLDGWPDEGIIDLTLKDWWKSPALQMRPREVHFKIPFVGFDETVPVFDVESLDDPEFLEIDLFRIALPPRKTTPLSPDFRNRYLFEFVLPPAELMFKRRQQRAKGETHHVDRGLTLDRVRVELALYRQIALFLHQAGLRVLIRESVDDAPLQLVNPQESPLSHQHLAPEEILNQLDQIQLRQRILNRSWSERANKGLLEIFVEMVPARLNVESCHIFIRQQEGDDYWLACGTGNIGGELMQATSTGHKGCSLVAQVIQEGTYQVVEPPMIQHDPYWQELPQSNPDTRNALCVPISHLSGQGVSGAILIRNKSHDADFSEADRRFLERIAQHLETASESLYLRQELLNFSEILSQKVGNSRLWQMLVGLLSMVLLAETALLFLLNS
uniref:Putative GAF sensor protein n=1 Tax=Magnetococcus massalia (strain MO-1) TaxID=451514 RepID=A0A1S7LKK9_MAGMO|nr:putative GAF sensor protein [Candidatus Magnetococcus massalia]